MIVSLHLIVYILPDKNLLTWNKNKAHAEHDMSHMYLI